MADGHAFYTPGLSENRAGVSRFYSFDRLGNLWTVDGSSKNQLYYQDSTGFGSLFALSGSGTPFAFSGGNGCQTDADTGLVLMGHRYYDGRQGRFISQDPAGDGDNWYAYAGNDPVNKIDPSGLITQGDAVAGAQAMADGTPGLYDHWEVTNGDYEHAKYLYTTEVGFQSSISIMGFHPGIYLSFPGNTGSQFLIQRLKYAKVEFQREHNKIKRGEWLSAHVGKGNGWDLKKDVLKSKDPILWVSRDNGGNFMYGAIAIKDGFNTQEVLFGAGYAQYKDQGFADAMSHVFSHFDDAPGQAEIAAGIKWENIGEPVFNVVSP